MAVSGAIHSLPRTIPRLIGIRPPGTAKVSVSHRRIKENAIRSTAQPLVQPHPSRIQLEPRLAFQSSELCSHAEKPNSRLPIACFFYQLRRSLPEQSHSYRYRHFSEAECRPKPPPKPTSRRPSPQSSPPPPQARSGPAPNILLLLHGLGDSATGFSAFGRALNLPETTVVTIQGPAPVPFDLGGFHWGDDVSFDSSTGGLDMDAGFNKSTRLLREVIRDVLMTKCGYRAREILVLGFGQGGMAGLMIGREFGGGSEAEALAGVVSIGAAFPLSGSAAGAKSRAPVLLLAGRDSVVVSDSAVKRTKGGFRVCGG
ncbi:hypothetical protein N7470_006075 [Penicillium chermesinum]|nr:hypothetical protein N7470_006075 [Penicillium chermesinum]